MLPALFLLAQTVSPYVTTSDLTSALAPRPPVNFVSSAPRAGVPLILIDERDTHQTIEGFGASIADSSAYLLHQVLPASKLPAVMNSLFDPVNGIGVAFLRNPMGASDLARGRYSYDDLPADATDPTLAKFSIEHDQADILPLLLMAKRINPRIKTMGTPWSPPGWMKTTASMVGGSLKPAAYGPWASYFVKYLQAYAAAGVPVDYISMQNEPLYLPTDYPGMWMTADEQLNLLKNYLLPALTDAKLTTKVLIFDHNWDQPDFPRAMLADAAVAASANLGGTAWHWYGGPPGAMTTIHNLHPTLPNYVTEASGGTWVANEVKQDFEMIVHSMRSWASAYVKWGLALDQNRGPHSGGCGNCSPLVTINTQTGEVTYPADYYTLGHFSKFVEPGSVAVWSSNAPGLISAAFVTPSEQRVLIVFNETPAARDFEAQWRGLTFAYTLPALSGATFTWKPSRLARAAHRGPRYTVPAAAQIQASSYTSVWGLQSEACEDDGAGFDLGFASSGSWAAYSSVDFAGGVSALDLRWASAGNGATLEVRADSPTGPTIATATLPSTGGWQAWRTYGAQVSGDVRGVHDVYVVFSGSSSLGNLNWLKFH